MVGNVFRERIGKRFSSIRWCAFARSAGRGWPLLPVALCWLCGCAAGTADPTSVWARWDPTYRRAVLRDAPANLDEQEYDSFTIGAQRQPCVERILRRPVAFDELVCYIEVFRENVSDEIPPCQWFLIRHAGRDILVAGNVRPLMAALDGFDPDMPLGTMASWPVKHVEFRVRDAALGRQLDEIPRHAWDIGCYDASWNPEDGPGAGGPTVWLTIAGHRFLDQAAIFMPGLPGEYTGDEDELTLKSWRTERALKLIDAAWRRAWAILLARTPGAPPPLDDEAND